MQGPHAITRSAQLSSGRPRLLFSSTSLSRRERKGRRGSEVRSVGGETRDGGEEEEEEERIKDSRWREQVRGEAHGNKGAAAGGWPPGRGWWWWWGSRWCTRCAGVRREGEELLGASHACPLLLGRSTTTRQCSQRGTLSLSLSEPVGPVHQAPLC